MTAAESKKNSPADPRMSLYAKFSYAVDGHRRGYLAALRIGTLMLGKPPTLTGF